jgi:hypothetical protein
MADSKTMTPNALARTLSVKLHRTITPKSIRSYARERIGRFGDDAYTSHGYTPAEVSAISAAFAARSERSKAQAPKSTPKTRPVHKVGPKPVPSNQTA